MSCRRARGCMPLVLLLLLPLLTGCTSRQLRMSKRDEGRYNTGLPDPAEWTRVKPGGADRAWWNQQLAATIYTDSNCHKRYHDAPLPNMMTHLLHGLMSVEDLEERQLSLAGREALLVVRKGELDGAAVQVGAVVLKKGSCSYDLVYIAPPANFQAGWDSYWAVVSTFQTFGDPA